MAELNETVASGLAAYYEYVAEHLHKWVDPLTNEQFWRKPYPYGNSVGHLVLHLTGNLSYYIGARIAETGYVRNRDKEFTDSNPPHKDEALRAFDRTVGMVMATIRKQREEDWGKAASWPPAPEPARAGARRASACAARCPRCSPAGGCGRGRPEASS